MVHTVRLLFVVVGGLLFLMGTFWALQGAYIVPATFMRGPAWIGIGTGVSVLGLLLLFIGAMRPRVKSTPKAA